MPQFGTLSKSRLVTCDPKLQDLAYAAIRLTDFSVACGHRGEQEQNEKFAQGFSQLRWPHSKHNKMPSLAMDLIPWPVDWGNIGRFQALAKIVKAEAAKLGIAIEWGGDWKAFKDWPHYQLKDA